MAKKDSALGKAEPLDALVAFLIEYSELYGSLDPSGQIPVDGRLEADVDLRVRGRFKAANMKDHLTALLSEEANLRKSGSHLAPGIHSNHGAEIRTSTGCHGVLTRREMRYLSDIWI